MNWETEPLARRVVADVLAWVALVAFVALLFWFTPGGH